MPQILWELLEVVRLNCHSVFDLCRRIGEVQITLFHFLITSGLPTIAPLAALRYIASVSVSVNWLLRLSNSAKSFAFSSSSVSLDVIAAMRSSGSIGAWAFLSTSETISSISFEILVPLREVLSIWIGQQLFDVGRISSISFELRKVRF